MSDIYRISFVKLLRALAEQARNDFADEVFDAESTGERPDLEPAVVEIAVEFAEDISDAIEALQARVRELEDDVSACNKIISNNLTQRAMDMEDARNNALEDAARMVDCSCECRDAVLAAKTKVDRWNACGRDPCGALDAADIRAMKVQNIPG